MKQEPVICPYCNNESELVGGKEIYPWRPDLCERKFYMCKPCKAYVGTHRKTGEPFGGLANAGLRAFRKSAHASFDPPWRETSINRHQAYAWLAEQMGIPREHCHIGMFDVEMCEKAIEICKHRKPGEARHRATLNTAFHRDEDYPVIDSFDEDSFH